MARAYISLRTYINSGLREKINKEEICGISYPFWLKEKDERFWQIPSYRFGPKNNIISIQNLSWVWLSKC